MSMQFFRKLPIPQEVKEMFPISAELAAIRETHIAEIKDILAGRDNRFLMIIGPCSADSEDPVIEYITRLRKVQEKVKDKILIIPRIYTGKPRTTGDGYKGLLHQPDPHAKPDMYKGIVAIRKLHLRALQETGFSCADEMLYPENHRYLSDLLAYVAIGARSVENQQHRLTASGIDEPVGMKNPTSGDLRVMMNSLVAAQHSHTFLSRGWEVQSSGNPYAHAILRGFVNEQGQSQPNYHFEDLNYLSEMYLAQGLQNPAVVIDTNHANSGKKYLEQVRIAKEVLHSCRHSEAVHKMVKGLMVESYLVDGAQSPEGNCYGQSITDPCLGWDKTERLLLEMADIL